MKCYQAGYPRPQFVRKQNSWENLNGEWDFAFDDKNEGVEKRWHVLFPQGLSINVPFSFESPASGIGEASRHNVIWYRRQIAINSKRKHDHKVILHFEGSDYNTQIWVNGKYSGSHDGAYARFSFDITHFVKSGNNTITVRVEDSFDISQPRGKQRWMEENFGCWYIQTSGIWKTVWIEYVNIENIKSVKMTPLFSEGKLEIEAELEASYGGDLELTTEISIKNTTVSNVTIPASGERIFIIADVYPPANFNADECAWSPDNPNLYDIAFTLTRKGKLLDEVISYFGMREIRIEGNAILLNGKPLYQRLILNQGYWKDSHLTTPDEYSLIKDIDKVIAAGYNGVRLHQKTEDERFLYWADVRGLLVWGEMASAYEFNDYAVTSFTREWMEVLKQFYNHPSIITWTPFNESWGIAKIKTDLIQQKFTESIYHLTKSYDKFRPVISNDGWEHTISDIITLHDYEESAEVFSHRYQTELKKILDNEIYYNHFKSVFADGYQYNGQPIIISEFGGIAFNNFSEGWGYGSRETTKEDFLKRFDAITTAVKKASALCGYCYTQISDVQQEINGIMDMERNFKVEPEILKEINEREVEKSSPDY